MKNVEKRSMDISACRRGSNHTKQRIPTNAIEKKSRRTGKPL